MFGLIGVKDNCKYEVDTQPATIYKNALLSVLTTEGNQCVLSCLIWRVNRHTLTREVLAVGRFGPVSALGIWAGIACELHSARR